MKLSITSMIELAKFILFVVRAVKELVVEIEQAMPEPGRGAEKFSLVKKTLTTVASYMGISTAVLETVDGLLDDKINEAVAEEINNG